jgi:formylglycine-generating enzyme required for sulfatase activity
MRLFKAPGIVTMGSSRREPGRRSNEVEYQVKLTKAFYVSTLETTNAQYREFESAHTSGNYQRKSLDLNNYPVVQISWQQAALYCNWLSKREQLTPFYTTKSGFVSGVNNGAKGYRLLSEAEWTWLASHSMNSTDSGSRKIYPWGDTEKLPQGFIFGNVADERARDLINFILEGYDDGHVSAAAVGSFTANAKGIFDLDGNVAEWTHDWYSARGSKPAADTANDGMALDPLGPEIGEYHVIKGPSWARGYLPQLRLAYRDSSAKGRHDVGFRVARYAHK